MPFFLSPVVQVNVGGRMGHNTYKVDHPKPLRTKIKDKIKDLFSKLHRF